MHLDWELLSPQYPGIYVLRAGGLEIARVNARVDGKGWLSEVARHRQDWRRRLHVVAPSEAAARRWALRWTRAHLAQIEAELPTFDGKRLVWPEGNRPG